MANILLIHGTWHGGWCWHKVTNELSHRGHAVLAPDMPGHGDDHAPLAEVNLAAYCASTVRPLRDMDGPSTLVGHSMGGMIISAAAEAAPELVNKLIYLCAFVPRNGEALLTASEEISTPGATTGRLTPTEEGLGLVIDDEVIRPAFYRDCSDADVAFAKSRLVTQALVPLTDKIQLGDQRFSGVRKAYIECIEDEHIHIVAQRTMYRRAGIDAVATLNTSHSPFFSAPNDLVDAIEQLL